MFEEEVLLLLERAEGFNRITGVFPFAFSAKKKRARWIRSRLFYYQFMLNRFVGLCAQLGFMGAAFFGVRALRSGHDLSMTVVVFLALVSAFNPVLILLDHITWSRRHEILSCMNSFIRLTAVVDGEKPTSAKAKSQLFQNFRLLCAF